MAKAQSDALRQVWSDKNVLEMLGDEANPGARFVGHMRSGLSPPKDPSMQTPELIRKGQDIDIFSVLSGFLTAGDRSPQVQAIAAQGLASLSDRSAPLAPYRGPTEGYDSTGIVMMLTLLWPDIAGTLADPTFLAAADALDPTSVPQLVAAAAQTMDLDAPLIAAQLLPWLPRTAAWAATLDPTQSWDAFTMTTVSTLANVATSLEDPAVEAMLSDPALLAPLLALADATNRAAGGATTAAAGSPDTFFTPNSLGAVSTATTMATAALQTLSAANRVAEKGATKRAAAGEGAPGGAGGAAAAEGAAGTTAGATAGTGATASGATASAAGGATTGAPTSGAAGTPPTTPAAGVGDTGMPTKAAPAAAAPTPAKSRGS